ncbi:unnamed protein product, partial [Amoebophrya sp. A120]
ECYSGVLRPKRSRASMLLKQNPNLQKEAFDEYGRRRSSFPTVLAHNGAMGGKRLSGLQQPSNQDNVRLMSIRSDAILPGGVSQEDLILLQKAQRKKRLCWWCPCISLRSKTSSFSPVT